MCGQKLNCGNCFALSVFSLAAIDPRSRFKRRATEMQLEDHSRAMERFAGEKFLLADDDEDDDETEIGKVMVSVLLYIC